MKQMKAAKHRRKRASGWLLLGDNNSCRVQTESDLPFDKVETENCYLSPSFVTIRTENFLLLFVSVLFACFCSVDVPLRDNLLKKHDSGQHAFSSQEILHSESSRMLFEPTCGPCPACSSEQFHGNKAMTLIKIATYHKFRPGSLRTEDSTSCLKFDGNAFPFMKQQGQFLKY